MKFFRVGLTIFIFLTTTLLTLPQWSQSAWAGPGKGKGPPSHAPAHGYRAKHQYHYYPNTNVYFEPVRGVYFYLSAGIWKVSVSLPTSLKINLGDSISMELDTDKPYIFNSEHKAKYPPGQLKKKYKNKPKKK